MPKPLLFGDKTLDYQQLEEIEALQAGGWDSSYVPGYSEKRRENELRVAKGLQEVALPRLQWVRANHVDGRAIATSEMYKWAKLGYQRVTEEDFEDLGISMPPAAHKGADGSICKEDLVLCYVPEDVAKRNKLRQEAETARFQGMGAGDHIEIQERKDTKVSTLPKEED